MKIKQMMYQLILRINLLMLLSISTPWMAVHAQEVLLIRGQVIHPSNLQQGDRIPVGTVITTKQNALVILEYSWPSDVQDLPCQQYLIISGKQTYPVTRKEKPGDCQPSSNSNELDRANRGEAFISSLTFYGESKGDMVAPEKVQKSNNLRNEFYRKIEKLKLKTPLKSIISPSSPFPKHDAPPSNMSNMEWNIDLKGSDLSNFTLQTADPKLCQDACANEPRCKAWTYVKPGTIQGSMARCWLKSAIPPPTQSPCCVSGKKLE